MVCLLLVVSGWSELKKQKYLNSIWHIYFITLLNFWDPKMSCFSLNTQIWLIKTFWYTRRRSIFENLNWTLLLCILNWPVLVSLFAHASTYVCMYCTTHHVCHFMYTCPPGKPPEYRRRENRLCNSRSEISEKITRSPSDVTEINFTPPWSLLNRRFRMSPL